MYGNPSNATSNPVINKVNPKINGNNFFHPKIISWSYLYLGKIPLTRINKKQKKTIFNAKNSSCKNTKLKKNGDNHPPKYKIDAKADISNILQYSPKKNIANIIEEYSILYPATISASASGKSKGALLVSANTDIKKTKKAGHNKNIKKTPCCFKTISFKFKEPEHMITGNTDKLIVISYEIIWATDLKEPNSAYFELLAHPDNISP